MKRKSPCRSTVHLVPLWYITVGPAETTMGQHRRMRAVNSINLFLSKSYSELFHILYQDRLPVLTLRNNWQRFTEISLENNAFWKLSGILQRMHKHCVSHFKAIKTETHSWGCHLKVTEQAMVEDKRGSPELQKLYPWCILEPVLPHWWPFLLLSPSQRPQILLFSVREALATHFHWTWRKKKHKYFYLWMIKN